MRRREHRTLPVGVAALLIFCVLGAFSPARLAVGSPARSSADVSVGGSVPDTQDSPLDLLPMPISGRKLLLKDGGEGGSEKALEIVSLDRHLSLARFRASNPVYGGMGVRVVSSGFFDDTYALPASGWRPIYVNGDLQAYVYEDPGQINGPITYARIASGKIKVVGQGSMLGHSLGETGPGCVSVLVYVRDADFIMSFGGTMSFRPFKAFKAVYADAPEPAVFCSP